jgi:uncharacterized protein (UPF0332 family)
MSGSNELQVEPEMRVVQQFIDLWIKPEIERRQEIGDLPEDFNLVASQVVMNFNAPVEVRLNNEIEVVVSGKATENYPSVQGKVPISAALQTIEGIELTDADSNAGHFTMLLHKGEWYVAFDFRYNAQHSFEHLEAARQFLDSAKLSLANEQLRVVVSNLFNAVELMAQGELIMHDKTVYQSRKHGLVHGRFNKWGHLGNTSSDYTHLLNKLSSLRDAARYLKKDFNLTSEEAERMVNAAEDMFADLKAKLPKRVQVANNVAAE